MLDYLEMDDEMKCLIKRAVVNVLACFLVMLLFCSLLLMAL